MNPDRIDRLSLDLSPNRAARVLSFCIAGLVSAHVLGLVSTYVLHHDYVRGLIPLFDMDRERNIPTFVSSALFVVGSAGFLLLQRLDETAERSGRRWFVLAVIFLFLAFDEWLAIHELLIDPVQEFLGVTGVFFYAWAIPYMILVAALAAYVLPRVLVLSSEIRYLFLVSATLYILGAVGFEFFGAVYIGQLGREGYDPFVFDVLTAIEETLELTGQAIVIYAQVRLAALETDEFRIRFRTKALS